MNSTLKKILGILAVAIVALVTIIYVKRMPPMLKLLMLGANVITIYLAYAWIKGKKLKSRKEE